MLCPICRNEIQEQTIYCSFCGIKIREEFDGNQVELEKSSREIREIIDLDTLNPRPWVRYWARLIDYYLFGVIFVIILYLISPNVLVVDYELIKEEDIYNFLIIFLWIFVEAILLSIWGTTPGKWLLKIKVLDSSGKALDFSSTTKRSFLVWWRGMGIGIPIITFIALIIAHGKLTKKGKTSWDRDLGFTVSHGKIGSLRTFLAIIIVFGFFLSIVWGSMNDY